MLTKRKALEKTIEMWSWLAENPDKDKEDFFEFKNISNIPYSECYCCEFDGIWGNCRNCPIINWNYDADNNMIVVDRCTNSGSAYGIWRSAIVSTKTKQQAARRIAELAELELNKLKKANVDLVEIKEGFYSYYDIYPEEIFDYQLVEPENIKGVVESGETTVTFYYEHKDVELKVSYVDFDGNELIPAGKLTGKTLDSYQAIPAEINGYNVVIIPENASGVLHENSSDIQFVYKLKPATVSVNYLDVDGKQIINSEIIYGRVFDEYNTVPKEIDGYELVEIPENASGKMTEEDISVDYIYRLMYS